MPLPLTPPQLDRYLARLRYQGPRDVSLRTLRDLHRAHLLAIPYENLDIHLGVPVSLDPEEMFAKLVDECRGGWCYEMNGVFGRVLATLGFDVRYVSGAVGRGARGWRAQGNHLVLIVTLDRRWIADVGFGDGFLTPLPLEAGGYRQDFLEYRVSRDGPRWRVDNHAFGGADGFDFTLTERTLADFSAQCHELQTSPASPFVTTAVLERFEAGGIVILRGAMLREVRAAGVVDREVRDAGDYASLLRDRFGLSIADAAMLWPRVRQQHEAWLARTADAGSPA